MSRKFIETSIIKDSQENIRLFAAAGEPTIDFTDPR